MTKRTPTSTRSDTLRIQSDVDREAIPFYERFGFRLLGRDGTIMFKDL
jgi:hypothetical protein